MKMNSTLPGSLPFAFVLCVCYFNVRMEGIPRTHAPSMFTAPEMTPWPPCLTLSFLLTQVPAGTEHETIRKASERQYETKTKSCYVMCHLVIRADIIPQFQG